VTISIFTLLAPAAVTYWSVDEQTHKEGPSLLTWIGFPCEGFFPALVLPLLLTAFLFLGPLVNAALQWYDQLILARGNDAAWKFEHVHRAWLAVHRVITCYHIDFNKC
jgi:hypothetical protein